MGNILEKVVGDFGGKRRWWDYKARIKALPANYRASAEALERYLMYFGSSKSDSLMTMFEDLADLLEQAAADEIPIREALGDDPVVFAEEFLANYPVSEWIGREQKRLGEAIARAAEQESR
ncbi:DUF1048 domain-containing protein [Sciscionella sediminilitoris]|uniref:DUF1048 domain-containing protein n=1 Tax=Sciscionella sediminilitoris TaxID=1445613 RepID=UPI0004DFBED1|nr:DUF1048 domain-containing protein [Sciscionella sp. SE31]